MTSRDGGATWLSVATIPDAPVTAVSYHPTDARVVYAYVARPDLGLVRSGDGGATWQAVGLVAAAQAPIVVVALGPGDHVVIATTQADVLRSRSALRRGAPRRGRPR